MKKLNYLLIVLVILGLAVITSCNEDDDNDINLKPTLNFTGGTQYVSTDTTVETNETFTIGVTALSNTNSGKKLQNFKITQVTNNNPNVIYDSTFSSSTFQMEFNFTPTQESVFNLIFKVTDKAGEYKEKTIKITVVAGGTYVYKFTDITMGSYNDQNYGSFYSTSEDQVYFDDEAFNNQGKVDWCYFLGVTNGETIAAVDDPDAESVFAIIDDNWTVRNETRFTIATISHTEFDAIADGGIVVFPAWTSGNSKINQLKANDVVFFKLQDGKLGYIKINTVNKKGDQINIDLVVTKP